MDMPEENYESSKFTEVLKREQVVAVFGAYFSTV